MRNRIAIILLSFLAFVSCHTEKKAVSKLDPVFTDGAFHLALYSTPSRDCVVCLKKAIGFLNNTVTADEAVYIIIKPPVVAEVSGFKKFVSEEFPGGSYHYCEIDFKLPTPSIILFKDKAVYMYFYIPADIYELKDTMDKCLELFGRMKI